MRISGHRNDHPGQRRKRMMNKRFAQPRRLARWAFAAAIMVLPAQSALAQGSATVSGRVTSEAGQPLQFASVSITALGLGAQTDANGRYSFVVAGARALGQTVQLSARALGYRPSSLPIVLSPGAVAKDFVLVANPLRLGEVVVTGSGTSSTREVLGTVTTTVEAVDIVKSSERNIVNALASKAPGVTITSSSGDPGAGTSISIRGIKTIQGDGQPLFVIDGMPIDNTAQQTTSGGGDGGGAIASNRLVDMNPNDVESVEILKGAAAAAIYGQRAANGVILITTKSGRAGPTRYSWSTSLNLDQVNRATPLQRSFGLGNGGVTPGCNFTTCAPGASNRGRNWGPALAAGTVTYDHFGELFKVASNLDNQLSISGGDAARTFFLSLGATNQDGIIKGPNNYMNRYNIRLKATQSLGNKIKLGGNVAYIQNNGSFVQRGSNLSGLLLGATRTSPEFNQDPYLTDLGYARSYRRPNPNGIQDPIYENPLWAQNQQKNLTDVNRVVGNLSLEYQPMSWLRVNYTLGEDYFTDQRLTALPVNSAGAALSGQLTQGTITNLQLDHNLLVTANKKVTSWLDATTTVGQNLNSRTSRTNQVFGQGYIGTGIFTLNNLVSTNLQAQNFESKVNIAGYFAQQEVNLWDQLYLKGLVRADQASSYSKENRTNIFPAFSAAWNVTNFLNNRNQKGLLSYLKLRGAYGETGREPNPYQNLSYVSSGAQGTSFGTGTANASQAGFGGLYTSGTRGSPNLGPERTAETEAGVDFALFNQKVDGTFTFYNAKSTNVILNLPASTTTGYTGLATNGAGLTNKGFEVQLNTRVLDRPNFRAELGLNWARNRSIVNTLGGAEFQSVPGAFSPGSAVVGKPLGVFWSSDIGRCRLGLTDEDNTVQDNSGNNIDLNAACRAAGAPNGAVYIDADGFPIQDQANRDIGDPNPDWTGAVRVGFTFFKKLNVSTLVDIRRGGDVYNGTRGALYQFGTWKETEKRANCTSTGCTGNELVFGETFQPGPTFGPGKGKPVPIGENYYADGVGGGGGIFTGVSGPLIEDGSWTRLREVSASYSFTGQWLKNLFNLSSADLRVAGRNLLLSAKYSGIDPETNINGSTTIDRGADYFNNPQTRSFVISVSLNR
jgi:TonB-linked SusC/RagA family outer membrane protein